MVETVDLYDNNIPAELKALQQDTGLSDKHILTLAKNYPKEVSNPKSKMCLVIESFTAFFGIKETEKIIDEELNFFDMMEKMIDMSLIKLETRERTTKTKEEIQDKKNNIVNFAQEDIKMQNELLDIAEKIHDMKERKVEVTWDDPTREKIIKENFANNKDKIIISYISSKELTYPKTLDILKQSTYAQNSEDKNLSDVYLVEKLDKMPGSLIKDLGLPKEQANTLKEINYNTLQEILTRQNHLINEDLLIKAIKHQKKTDKIQDKLLKDKKIDAEERQKYGPKIIKAVIAEAMDKVFRKPAKNYKSELDAVHMLADYITTGTTKNRNNIDINNINKDYTYKRSYTRDNYINNNKNNEIEKHKKEIEDLQKKAEDILEKQEKLRNTELNEAIAAITNITGGFDVESIISDKYQHSGTSTLCSRTACINIYKLDDNFQESMGNQVPTGDAKHLMRQLLKQKKADVLKTQSFTDQEEVAKIEQYFKDKALVSQGSVFDIYFNTQKKHRSVVFLGSDGKVYALDPYYGGGKTQKPIPLNQLLKNISTKVTNTDIIVNNTVYAQISKESQKNLQSIYERTIESSRLENGLVEWYGSEDIIDILSQYSNFYEDPTIDNLPLTENADTTLQNGNPTNKINTTEKIYNNGFSLQLLKTKVPKLYGNISHQQLYNAIINIANNSIKEQCIEKIKTQKIIEFQEILGMIKNAPIHNRADGKIGYYTLQKIMTQHNQTAEK